MDLDLAELSAAQLLARAEANVSERRQAEVDQLLLTLAWCDRNGDDPRSGPGAVPVARGGDRLVRLGGDGTPEVAELSIAELAVAFQAGDISTHHLAAAALDLRHRLPSLWSLVLELRMPVWLARKVAVMSRELDRDAVVLVDVAVAAAVNESPGRILRIAEAKVIEADLAAHRARVAEDARKTGCWLSKPRPGEIIDPVAGGEAATRRFAAKLPAGAATELDAVIDDLADALAAHQDRSEDEEPATRAQLRAEALALLADPHAAARFLDGLHEPSPAPAPAPTDDTPASEPPAKPTRRRKAIVHVHLSALALAGLLPGVARVEGLGPFLLEQLAELLGRDDITLQPVLDLAGLTSVNSYEHPTVVRQRALQRTCGDVFPHSTSAPGVGGRLDLDHPTPYVPTARGGPPGQTGDHNAAPLTRRHHRIKTHGHLPDGGGGYHVRQLGLTAYRWITPHGLARVVTPHGTTRVELLRTSDGTVLGECYPDPPVVLVDGDLAELH
ncbi:hypothetical protein FHP29_10535 [Nocardioides albidus]|uniref:DUF222 domain-containing protein n=1 Tax=Nocardioides albidus TaxID=1517589 RepID=A0A5C4VZ17_9ACTN|nr:hypothetical protein [Nocardioides albidus]TNM40475.1 hypothetical protein FHP29_10535 [Nocardioides albidus]